MAEKSNTEMSPLCIGILAHVDAGKTTLSEALLYTSGALRRLGRVDHADAFLDTDPQERERGITIFSKQARLTWKNRAVTLLDTPGHVDFSGETERTLPVLDAAILVVSGTDGVQSHTRTLWRLLRRNHVPTFLFINKTDLPSVNRAARMQELRSLLSPECADFSGTDWMEQAAAESEAALESFLSAGTIPPEEVRRLIAEEKLFPCLFGAALRLDGVEKLLDTLVLYATVKPAGDAFGARVYKISRDAQGARLTWLRVTGGELRARAAVKVPTESGETEEKIHQIRLYSGGKYELTDAVKAGTVCAVTGLTAAHSGDALGAEKGKSAALLEPVFTYRVHAEKADPHTVLEKLRLLEEEDPLLHVVYDEAAREICVQLMGEVQLEILERLCRSRFGLEITFGEGGILYRETIAAPVEGVGHYEPLRHYAEVHLLLEPLERGSGLVFASKCSTDALDLNWQRLILTHLAEKEHRGPRRVAARFKQHKLSPSFHENCHHPSQHSRNHRHADRSEQPFFAPVFGRDVGLQILPPRDCPGVCMSNPPFINPDAVDQIQHRQHPQQLPKPLPKAPRAVDRVDTAQRIGQLERQAAELEAQTVSPDPLRHRQPQLHTACLHIRMVKMQHAKTAALQNCPKHHHFPLSSIFVLPIPASAA